MTKDAPPNRAARRLTALRKYLALGLAAALLANCNGSVITTSPGPTAAPTSAPVAADRTISLGNIVFSPLIQILQAELDVTIEQDQDGFWAVAGLVSEDRLPSQFVDSISRIRGSAAELPPAASPVFTVIADEIMLEFYKHDDDFYVTESGTAFKVTNPTTFLANFELMTLVTPARLGVTAAEITAIKVFNQQDELLHLSARTDLSEAETFALLSGWYLHDHYYRSYPIELGKNNELLASTGDLKLLSEGTSDIAADLTYLRTVEVTSAGETLRFNIHVDDESNYYAETSTGYFYRVSTGQAELYLADPFSLISKLLVVIPANYLERLTVSSGDQTYLATASGTDLDGRPIFEVNGKAVDQSEFRKVYQHVVAIAGVREYRDEDHELNPVSTIEYQFNADDAGSTQLTRTVELFALTGNPGLLVAKEDGRADFVVERTMLETALAQLAGL